MFVEIESVKLAGSQWDQWIEEFNGSVFLTQAWLQGIANEERKPVYLRFHEKGKTVALLSGLLRPVGAGPHQQLFCYSGISSSDPTSELLTHCKKQLLDYAVKNQIARIILKSYDSFNFLPAPQKPFVEFERAECIIDLSCSQEQLIKGFTKNVRRNARRTEGFGAIFNVGYSDALINKLFELTQETLEVRTSKGYGAYRILTMPFMDKDEIAKLVKAQSAHLFYIEHEGEVVSMQFAVQVGKRAYGILMGTTAKGYEIAAPSMLFMQIALWLQREGCKAYNVGGVPLGSANDGVKRFKKDLGAIETYSSEETTLFLIKPLTKLNFFLRLRNRIDSINMPWRLKKLIYRMLDLILKGREHY